MHIIYNNNGSIYTKSKNEDDGKSARVPAMNRQVKPGAVSYREFTRMMKEEEAKKK